MAESGAEVVKKGELLFLQGDMPKGIYLLQSGSCEILSAPAEYTGLDRSIIIDKSVRVGIFRANELLTGLSRNFIEPYSHSVRALEDSQVIRYPLNGGGFKNMAQADPSKAISILKQLYSRMTVFYRQLDKACMLNLNLMRISDNLGILYQGFSSSGVCESIEERSLRLYEKFRDKNKELPQVLSARFLLQDSSDISQRSCKGSAEIAREQMPAGFSDLIKNILASDPRYFSGCIKQNPDIASGIEAILTEAFQKIASEISVNIKEIISECDSLFGDTESWISFLADRGGLDQWQRNGRIDQEFVTHFIKLIARVNSLYEGIIGRRIIEDYPAIRKLQSPLKTAPETSPESVSPVETGQARAGAAADTGLLNRSLHQIFEFTLMDKEFQNRFLKLLNEFKTSKNPLSTESDGRKMRRNITKMYWDIYKQAYVRSKTQSVVPLPVKLMLKFGFIDEALLEPEQLAEIQDLARIKERNIEMPILFENEFLNFIYSGKVSPSITDMGLTYEGYLREQNKRIRRGSEKDASSDDDFLDKTMFEIDHRLATTAAVCSGSTATAFPILCSQIVKSGLRNLFFSKDRIQGQIRELMDIDFSVFYRETVLKMGEAREIIQEEIWPYVILLPIFGTKTFLWQELSGTNKRSRARIVIPVFFMGDLAKSLAHTFACFRWEINRTVKGALWADPVEGGLSGEYFDYVNTYKKNTKLSAEAKERIAERFKSLRTNRDRFADDYLSWVFFERNGIMKLNAVVRAMFFKYIPFKAEVRDRLENMPAFSQIANRYKNVNRKDIEMYERRFKKYQNEAGEYPVEMEKFFKFLST